MSARSNGRFAGIQKFEPKELLEAGLEEMRRTIREKEPPKRAPCCRPISRLSPTAARRIRPSWCIWSGESNEHRDVARSLNNLANAILSQGKLEEAEALHREVLAMRRKLLKRTKNVSGKPFGGGWLRAASAFFTELSQRVCYWRGDPRLAPLIMFGPQSPKSTRQLRAAPAFAAAENAVALANVLSRGYEQFR